MSASFWVSALASIAVHGCIILVLVRMGIWGRGPSLRFQGGVSGAEGDDGSPAAAMTLEAPAQLPPAVAQSAPVPVNVAPSELRDAVAMASIALPKAPVRMLDDSAALELIGVPGPANNDAPEFSHQLPDRLRQIFAAAREVGSSTNAPRAGTGNADAAYLMNQAGEARAARSSTSVANAARRAGVGEESAGNGGGDGPVASNGNRPPIYPAEAKRRRYEGTVLLNVRILEDGSVGEVTLQQSSGHDMLDRAAIEAVKKYHYTPRRVNGNLVGSTETQPVTFNLR